MNGNTLRYCHFIDKVLSFTVAMINNVSWSYNSYHPIQCTKAPDPWIDHPQLGGWRVWLPLACKEPWSVKFTWENSSIVLTSLLYWWCFLQQICLGRRRCLKAEGRFNTSTVLIFYVYWLSWKNLTSREVKDCWSCKFISGFMHCLVNGLEVHKFGSIRWLKLKGCLFLSSGFQFHYLVWWHGIQTNSIYNWS